MQLAEGYDIVPAGLRSTISYPRMFEHFGKLEAVAGKEYEASDPTAPM